MTDTLKTGLIVGVAVLVATGAVFLLVVVPNSVESAITERDAMWRDSLGAAPVVLRDTVTVVEEGRTSRHDTVFIRETTATQFYSESAETLASDNASVSFTLRESVNRETGEFARDFSGIRFRYPRITNTVAVNAPPMPEPTYQGIGYGFVLTSTWKTFNPVLTVNLGLKFNMGADLYPYFYARASETQTAEYGYGLRLEF